MIYPELWTMNLNNYEIQKIVINLISNLDKLALNSKRYENIYLGNPLTELQIIKIWQKNALNRNLSVRYKMWINIK